MDTSTQLQTDTQSGGCSPISRGRAENIAHALSPDVRPRTSSRGATWRVHCPAHRDRHPSLDITDADGQVLLVDRAGCSQREVIAALRARGLWQQEAPARVSERTTLRQQIEAALLKGRPSGQVYDRALFNVRFRIAFLRAELREAAAEVRDRYQRVGEPLTPDGLTSELRFAVEVGGIGTAGFDEPTIESATERMATEFLAVEGVCNANG
jgi:hypothetical protein